MAKNLDKMEELLNDCERFLRHKDYVFGPDDIEKISLCDHSPENLAQVRICIKSLLDRFYECFMEDYEGYGSLTSELILTSMQALRDVYALIEHHEDDDDDASLMHVTLNVWYGINGCFILAFAIERGDTSRESTEAFVDKFLTRLDIFSNRLDAYTMAKREKSQRVASTSFYALMRTGRQLVEEVKNTWKTE